MSNQDLIIKIKRRLRLKSDKFDEDIADYIEAAKKDMLRVGLEEVDISDPLIATCIEFYCKWLMGFEGDGERYEAAYEALRDSISLSISYGEL